MSTVTITEKARDEIKRIMSEQDMNMETTFFRVRVVGGGCSGFTTKLDLDAVCNEKIDEIEDGGDGLKVVIDRRSAMYITGATIDFHDGIDRRGFVVNNPNSKSTCGCGSSFSL